MIDVAGLKGAIDTTTITVRTFGTPTTNSMGEQIATYTDATRTAVVHPSGRKELERLGLDMKRATISVYDVAELGTSDAVRPPCVQYQSRWYEVVRVGDYATLGGIYLVHAALLPGDPRA
jgi:hypothetical protein